MPNQYVKFVGAEKVVRNTFGDNKKITLLTADSDYLFAAKSVKDELCAAGYFVSSLSIGDDCVDKFILQQLVKDIDNCVVVVGKAVFLNTARSVLGGLNKQVVLVSTDLNFFSVISQFGAINIKNKLSIERLPLFVTVIDPKIITTLKKTAVMEGFLEVASKLIFALDYALCQQIKKQEIDPKKMGELLAVISSLNAVGNDYAKNVIVIINAQYLLAQYSLKYDLPVFGEETFIGDILCSVTKQNRYSANYCVFKPLIDLYAAVFQKGITINDVLPDHGAAIYKLCDAKGCALIDVLNDYTPLNFDEINGVDLKAFAQSLAYLQKIEKLFDGLDGKLKFLFAGRKKLCKFNFDNLRDAFSVSAYQCATDFYKYINDSGAFDVFE